MLILLSLTLATLLKIEPNPQADGCDQTFVQPCSTSEVEQDFPPVIYFVLLLVLWGALLVSAPEFFYLRDLFGWRINTIFKFYYQAWLYWSLAATFASFYLLAKLRRIWKSIFQVILILIVGMALVYPILSLWSKTNGFNPSLWTLDSSAYMQYNSPDEMQAMRWLQEAPFGVIAEAVPEGGGSYTQYGRAATLTGKPAVLGWVGHENQWRGSSDALGSRQDDLVRLYCGRDWDDTVEILNKYQIRYIIIAPLEHAVYTTGSAACPIGLQEKKFERFLNPVFQQGAVVIYEYQGAE